MSRLTTRTGGLRAPRVAMLSGLGRAPWDEPLRPGELPSGALYFHPRYTLKVINDLLDDEVSLKTCEDWARDPPDWVKQKNKLGQDSFRLACFIRHRLNHRIPKNWIDTQIDSDASLIIEGRWKYNDLSMETLAEWSTQAPNWKPWNRNKDLTAVVMPAFLWARKVASARAGIDIPFFVDSTVENIVDTVVAGEKALFLAGIQFICNIAATLGIGAATSSAQAAQKVGEEATKQAAKTTTEKLTEVGVDTLKKVGEQEAKSAVKGEIRKGTQELAKDVDSRAGKGAVSAAGSGAAAGGVAVATALIAGTPIGWVGIAALVAAPLLCWLGTELALKLMKDNLRDWLPDLVPTLITRVYFARFGVAPTPEQVAELDQRYSWAISANSIAKAVASPENNPLIIDAVTQRQKVLRAAVNDAVGKLTNCKPNPVAVANLANTAFNDLWNEKQIADYVSANRLRLCLPTVSVTALSRTAALRSTLANLAVANIKPMSPVATANITPGTPKGDVVKKTLPNPPKAAAKSGVGAALALATGGFFVGGPVGAGIGFVVGLAAGGKKA